MKHGSHVIKENDFIGMQSHTVNGKDCFGKYYGFLEGHAVISMPMGTYYRWVVMYH